MPNIKSAEERVKVTAVKKLQNQMVRSQMNTAIKKYNTAIADNDAELAEKLLPETASLVDNAATHHIIHKNAANHKKAQLAKALYQLKNGIIVVKMDKKAQKQAEQKAAADRKAAEQAKITENIKAARQEKAAAKTVDKKKK